jgi:hypothetical protein
MNPDYYPDDSGVIDPYEMACQISILHSLFS